MKKFKNHHDLKKHSRASRLSAFYSSYRFEQDDQSSTSTSNSFTLQTSVSTGDLYSVNQLNDPFVDRSIQPLRSHLSSAGLLADVTPETREPPTRQPDRTSTKLNESVYSSQWYADQSSVVCPDQGYYSKCNSGSSPASEQCADCSHGHSFDSHSLHNGHHCAASPAASPANYAHDRQQSVSEEDDSFEDDLICSSPECKLTHSNCPNSHRHQQTANQTLRHLEENKKPFLQLRIFIPEFALEKSLIVSKREKIFKLKLYILDLIETIKQNCEQQQRDLQLFFSNTTWSKSTNNLSALLNNNDRNDTLSKSKLGRFSRTLHKSENCLSGAEQGEVFKLNNGLFCPLLGRFLEEERTIGDYSQLINNFIFYNHLKKNFAQDSVAGDFELSQLKPKSATTKNGAALLRNAGRPNEQQIDLPIYHFTDQHLKFNRSTLSLNLNQQKLYGLSKVNEELNILNNLVRKVIKYNFIELEFRYKQRVQLLVDMSTTLPTSTQTKKRRKRTRLLEAIAAGNVEKVAKQVQNCDPNFVDELSGETPLTLACSLHTTQTVATSAALNQNLTNGQSSQTNSSQDSKSSTLPNGTGSTGEKEKKKEKESSKFFTLKSSKTDKLDLNNEDAHPYINPKNVFNPAVIQRLIVTIVNGGALLDFRCKESGRTPLHVAVCKSNLIAIKTLLDLGCSPNHADANGLTPLYYSIIYRCSPKTTQQLLQHHACLNTRDNNGWCEIHHACKFGSVDQLELLLYYGCSIDSQISGSGNTGLHVAAINDQQACCRVLLQRGANTEIINGSHQTPYQTAVIAGNAQLADLIANHKPENVQRYPEKPKYNASQTKRVQLSAGDSFEYSSAVHGGRIRDDFGVKYCNSPCLSQRSNATTTATNTTNTSSGICCDAEETTSSHSGHQPNDQHSKNTNPYSTMRVPGRKSCLVNQQQNQQIASYATLPNRGRSEERKLTASNSVDSQKLSMQQPQIISYDEKTVMLKRTSKGFGFVLRGAKAPTPTQTDQPSTSKETQCKTLLNANNKENQRNQTNSPPQCLRPISLQYFEDIEPGGVAAQVGLKPGDFLIQINGVDVRSSVHEYVVNLIRQSGDQVTVTVATPIYQYDETPEQPLAGKAGAQPSSRKGSIITEEVYDLSNKKPSSTRCSAETLAHPIPNSNSDQLNRKAGPPPAIPKRDPNTTLSISRARAKSLCINDLIDDTFPPAPTDLSPIPPHEPHKGLTTSISLEPTSADQSNGLLNKQQTINYDSEGRSTKSSSPSSPSAQSIIHVTKSNKANAEQAAKIASIRSHSSRKVSAFELEERFAKQNGQPTGADAAKCGTLQTPKRKEKTNLEKRTHSTSDLQAELEEEKKKSEAAGDTQKDSHFETLTLKNGRFISNKQPVPPPGKEEPIKKEQQNENKQLETKESKLANSTSSSFKPSGSLDEPDKLHIPEPDYSDDDKQTNKTSTFKTPLDGRMAQSVCEPKEGDAQDRMSKSMISNESKLKSIGQLSKAGGSAASNKVKESIKQFERRNISLDGKRKLESLENMINSTTNGIYNMTGSGQVVHPKIPSSKSCFEVDVCDLEQNNGQSTEQDTAKEKAAGTKRSVESQYYTLVKQSSISQDPRLPTTAKTWSEISTAIRAAKGNPSISTMASTGSQLATKTLPSGASVTRPALKQGAIRVQVDPMALSAVNEIDVSTDVLLPPPEYRSGLTNSNVQLLQQQVHQAKQQQLLHAQQHKQNKAAKDEIKIVASQTKQQAAPQVINDPNTTIRKNLSGINASNLDAATRARLIQQVQQNAYLQQQQQQQSNLTGQLSSSQFATLTRYVKQQQLQTQANQQANQQYVTLSRLQNAGLDAQAQQACQLHNLQTATSNGTPTSQTTQSTQNADQQQQQMNLYGTTIAQQPSTNATNYYQFATLSRAQQNNLYSDYNKLTVQNRLIKPQHAVNQQQAQSLVVGAAAQPSTSTATNLSQAQLLQLAQQQPQLLNAQNTLLRKDLSTMNTSNLNASNLDPATRARLLQQQQQVGYLDLN